VNRDEYKQKQRKTVKLLSGKHAQQVSLTGRRSTEDMNVIGLVKASESAWRRH